MVELMKCLESAIFIIVEGHEHVLHILHVLILCNCFFERLLCNWEHPQLIRTCGRLQIKCLWCPFYSRNVCCWPWTWGTPKQSSNVTSALSLHDQIRTSQGGRWGKLTAASSSHSRQRCRHRRGSDGQLGSPSCRSLTQRRRIMPRGLSLYARCLWRLPLGVGRKSHNAPTHALRPVDPMEPLHTRMPSGMLLYRTSIFVFTGTIHTLLAVWEHSYLYTIKSRITLYSNECMTCSSNFITHVTTICLDITKATSQMHYLVIIDQSSSRTKHYIMSRWLMHYKPT
jgi:hypothetical protein